MCPVCGGPNGCRVADGSLYKGPCWCEGVKLSQAVTRQLEELQLAPACLCRGCLADLENCNVLAAEDFYIDERGFTVFTAAYHLKRGYCCNNQCRHCPWREPAKQPGAA